MLWNLTIEYFTFNTGEKEKEKHPPSASVEKGDDSNSSDDEPLFVLKEKLAAPKKTTEAQQYCNYVRQRNESLQKVGQKEALERLMSEKKQLEDKLLSEKKRRLQLEAEQERRKEKLEKERKEMEKKMERERKDKEKQEMERREKERVEMARREELQKAAERQRLEARKEEEREEAERRQREDAMRDRARLQAERIAQEQSRIQTDIEYEEWQDFVNKEDPILSESLDLPQVSACLCLIDVASFIIICCDLSVLTPLVQKLRLCMHCIATDVSLQVAKHRTWFNS